MAKSDRLLQAVLERPDDRSVLEVYGDALQARGDPRGALVSVQLQRELGRDESDVPRRGRARARANASGLAQGRTGGKGSRAGSAETQVDPRRALKAEEQELLEKHRAELYGPLAKLEEFTAAWRLGFLRELHVDVGGGRIELLVDALQRDAQALLERLVIKVDGTSALDALIDHLPARLQHLTIATSEGPWEGVLEALPPLRSLDLWGGPDIDFAGLRLPVLERLWLTSAFRSLDRHVAPSLKRLSLGSTTVQDVVQLPDGLELLRLFGEAWFDVELPAGLRCIHEFQVHTHIEGGMLGVGTVTRTEPGTAGERTLLLTTAGLPQLEAVFEPFAQIAGPYELRAAPVPFGTRGLLAVEVRVLRPRQTLLGELAAALGDAVEIVVSRAHRRAIVRDARQRVLASGADAHREDVWRVGLDRALGFDPGRTFDQVCELVDAERPRRANGDASTSLIGEWPCASPLPPLEARVIEHSDEPVFTEWWTGPP